MADRQVQAAQGQTAQMPARPSTQRATSDAMAILVVKAWGLDIMCTSAIAPPLRSEQLPGLE